LRVDVKASTYILNILTHYELGNIDLLPYLVKSTLNYFRSVNMLRKSDEYFVLMFKNIPLNSNRHELVLYLEEKKKVLVEIKTDSLVVSDIDYLMWIESKIKNQTLASLRDNKR